MQFLLLCCIICSVFVAAFGHVAHPVFLGARLGSAAVSEGFDSARFTSYSFHSLPASSTNNYLTMASNHNFHSSSKMSYLSSMMSRAEQSAVGPMSSYVTSRFYSDFFAASSTSAAVGNSYLSTIVSGYQFSAAQSVAPTLLPTPVPTASPTFVGETNNPSPSPTPLPTYSVADIWLQKLRSLEAITVPNHYYFSYLDVASSPVEVLAGSCTEYATFVNGDLYLASFLSEIASMTYSVYNTTYQSEPNDVRKCDDEDKIPDVLKALLSTQVATTTINCNGNDWVFNMCDGNKIPSVCVGCSDPCTSSCNSLSPFITNPCGNYDNNVCVEKAGDPNAGMIRMIDIGFKPPPLAPTMSALRVQNISRSSLSVKSNFNGLGTFVCGAFVESSPPPTSYSQILLQRMSTPIANTYDATLNFANLQPSTAYDIYCYTISVKQADMDFNLIATQGVVKGVSTLCCPYVNVKSSVSSMFKDTMKANAIVVSLDQPVPKNSLVVSVSLSVGSSEIPLVPASLTFSSITKNTVAYVSIPELATANIGEATIVVRIDDSESYEYNFGSFPSKIMILDDDAEPLVPRVIEVMFSDSGANLLVTFDSDTNKAVNVISNPNDFECSIVFGFTGADKARCQFTSASALLVKLGSSASIKNGDVFNITAGKFGAYGWQDGWDLNGFAQIFVKAPVYPLTPNVVFLAPIMVGSCDIFYFDLSQSSGSGGRPWKTILFDVDGPAQAAQDFANVLSNFIVSPPTKLLGSVFNNENALFTVTVTLTNFMDISSSASINLLATSELIPTTAIAGNNFIQMTRKSSFLAMSDTFVTTCDKGITRTSVEFGWTVTQDGAASALVSISKSPSSFKVNPYSLDVGSTYNFKVSSVYTVNMRSSSASVNVYIVPGNLIAVITGGSIRGVKAGGNITLSADQSIDEDQEDAKGSDAGLRFQWNCSQISPVFSEECPLEPQGGVQQQSVVYHAPVSTIGFQSSIVVNVYDNTRASSATVVVITLDADAAQVNMVSQFAGKINRDEELVIEATIDHLAAGSSEWTYDGPADLAAITLTPTSNSYPVNFDRIPRSNYLVVKPFSLPENSIMTFTLTAQQTSINGQISSFSRISVTINDPPNGGIFYSDPNSGTELQQIFTLAASLWNDEDLPLTYSFGFIDTGASQIVQGRSPSSFAYTLLGAGKDTSGYKVEILANIFDSYSASSKADPTFVTVSLANSDTKSQTINDLIANASSSNEKRQAVAVSSSSLNNKPCGYLSAYNCSKDYNRAECLSTANTCGSCLPDFPLGTAGDSNSLCYRLADRRRLMSLQDIPQQECPKINGVMCGGGDQGRCDYFKFNSNVATDSCSLTDISCYPLCVCDDGYAGSDCSFTTDSYLAAKATKKNLLLTLLSVTNNDEVTKDNVDSWGKSVQSLLTDKDGIPLDPISLQLPEAILLSAKVARVPTSSMASSVMESVDIVQQSFSNVLVGNPSLWSGENIVSDVWNKIGAIVAQFTSQVISEMVPGEPDSVLLYDNFRVVTTSNIRPNVTQDIGLLRLSSPRTSAEVAAGVPGQVVSIFMESDPSLEGNKNSFATAGLAVRRSLSENFDLSEDYESSPVTVYPGPWFTTGNLTINVTLYTLDDMVYVPTPDVLKTASVICDAGIGSVVSAPKITGCYDTLPDVNCPASDIYSQVDVYCPYDTSSPICALSGITTIVDANGDTNEISDVYCTTTGFDSSKTACDCSVPFNVVGSIAGSSITEVTLFSTTSAIKVHPNAVTVSIAQPTKAPSGRGKVVLEPKMIAIWSVFGSLLFLYFLMLCYVAYRRYVKRMQDPSKYMEPLVHPNHNSFGISPVSLQNETVVEDVQLQRINHLKTTISKKFAAAKSQDVNVNFASMDDVQLHKDLDRILLEDS